jgi:hypothetical protein
MFIFYHYLSDTPGLNYTDTCRIIYAEKTGGKQLGGGGWKNSSGGPLHAADVESNGLLLPTLQETKT